MTVNAQYIMDYLLADGWSKNAIAGMLGNMQTESSINPGIWQSLESYDHDPYRLVERQGYGLVQWTPFNKYTIWARDLGMDYSDINAQLARIEYELQNDIQWISTSDYPLTFKQFKTSTQTPEYLAQAFLRNYERPANQIQPERSTQSRHWFDTLSGEGSGASKPVFPTTIGLPVSSSYGWRVSPINGENEFHGAIDISGEGQNHPIYATQSGTVILNAWSDTGGWMVVIKHTGDQYYSRYLHLATASPISVGMDVVKGQEIGKMGTTGSSTGIHLDFAIAIDDKSWNTEEGTIDPEIYLQMSFGGGDPNVPPKREQMDALIHMYLANTLRGWG